ncbi:MAG: hypothetical protein ACPG5B_02270 [Chitinophagales bacterium]
MKTKQDVTINDKRKSRSAASCFSATTNRQQVITEVPKEISIFDYSSYGFQKLVPFYTYGNRFLHFLASLPEQSPTHAACIGTKATQIFGTGQFNIFEGEESCIADVNKKEKIDTKDERNYLAHAIINEVNGEGESLFKILEFAVLCYLIVGNAYIEMRRFQVGNKRFFEVKTHDPTLCQVNARKKRNDPKFVVVSPHFGSTFYDKNSHEIFSVYPKWTRHKKGYETSIIHFHDKKVGRFYYGLPSFISGHKSASIENETNTYNLKKFVEDFMPRAFINLFREEEWLKAEKKEVTHDFKKKFTGKNADRLLLGFHSGTNLKSEAMVLEDKSEGNFLNLKAENRKDIILAHKWSGTLLDPEGNGGNGSGGNKYLQVLLAKEATVISKLRKSFKVLVNKMYKEAADYMYPNQELAKTTLDWQSSLPKTYISNLDINKAIKNNPKLLPIILQELGLNLQIKNDNN